MDQDLSLTVYTPESPLRQPMKLFRGMLRDVAASRELAWRLFVRDTSAQYRQSVLGYVWAFLPPLATTSVFAFLNAQQVLNVGPTSVPYPAFVMIGTLFWQTFVDGLASPLKAIGGSRAMLTKINFPREAVILAGAADVLFNTLIRAALLVPVFMYYGITPGSSAWLVPLGVLALLLLGLSIGTVLVPAGMLYTDIGRGIALIGAFWMLLTPVVYPPPSSGVGALLARWNPVSPLLLASRQWLTGDPTSDPLGFAVVTLSAIALLLIGWVMIRVALPHLIERIGN